MEHIAPAARQHMPDDALELDGEASPQTKHEEQDKQEQENGNEVNSPASPNMEQNNLPSPDLRDFPTPMEEKVRLACESNAK